MSKLMVAVHEINYTEGATQKIATPGSVFTPNVNDMEFLMRAGAIREPSDAEIALHERIHGLSRPVAQAPAALDDSRRRRGRPRKNDAADPVDSLDEDDII
jgi:hypothetical protein